MKKILEEEKLIGVLEMAEAICHELNQPMQAISGYSEMLMADISKDNPLYADFKEIKRQIVRMANITKKLMRITRYETRDYIGGRRIIDIDKAIEVSKVPKVKSNRSRVQRFRGSGFTENLNSEP